MRVSGWQHHNREDVEGWLRVLGRKNDLKDWQFKQSVHAIQILFCELIKPDWAVDLDWEHWKSGATQLQSAHVTVGRENTPVTVAANDNVGGDVYSKGALAQARERNGEVVDRLIKAMRTDRYAYRTELSYVDWVCRFLAYC
ncbi:MAG: hypothetical protein U9R29_03565 [Thermodesulfobacteriota bacterium]|nr:hypothetical protein [Thermodesulfobacteriota bacterium]